jgi:hypothetical protein
MSDRHLQLTPHKIARDSHVWWYEEPTGIWVVQDYYRAKDGLYLGTHSVVIPWRAVRAALKRKDRR